jgi:SpoVK/Ycf46/Vps4 family AAA+-type ATPase
MPRYDDRDRRVKRIKRACPPITCLQDLIEAGKQNVIFYNIDTIALWNILPHLIRLQNLVGMESVKKSIFRQIVYYLQGMHKQNLQGEFLHTCITGPPGTGKTTVSEILGHIYRDLGILGNGLLTTIHRDDLVAGYVGQTALKTKKLLEKCLGGVVFLDEAYSMGAEGKDNGDVFAKEAIDTLTSFLSEHKNDFCFIIAGYEEDIKKYFFSLNKGLERRFPWKHKINIYTPQELARIAIKMIKDIFWSTSLSEDNLAMLISKNKECFKHAGGDVENFIFKSKIAHANRVFTLTNEIKFQLSEKDFLEGIAIMKENSDTDVESKNYLQMYT